MSKHETVLNLISQQPIRVRMKKAVINTEVFEAELSFTVSDLLQNRVPGLTEFKKTHCPQPDLSDLDTALHSALWDAHDYYWDETELFHRVEEKTDEEYEIQFLDAENREIPFSELIPGIIPLDIPAYKTAVQNLLKGK